MNSVMCPGCGSGRIRRKGAIPENRLFAGNLVSPLPADLAICLECRLGFRSPQPPQAELVRLYECGAETAWTIEVDQRFDWNVAAECVAKVGASSVLDVGCFDGGFLELLTKSVRKAGVEVNAAAAQRAAELGIEIVADDLHDLAAIEERFDVVTAFDVIEHVHDPSSFLACLSTAVKPGGHIIFATGNLAAPTWRLMGRRYLYSWYLEHIAFVSPRWIRREAPNLGFEVVSITRFSHTSHVRFGFVLGMLKNGVFKISPRLLGEIRFRLARSNEELAAPVAPPAWTSARDHILVLLRKTK